MKKLLTLTAVGAVLITPAFSVQKCVALGDTASISCTATEASDGDVNWSATCTTGAKTIPVKGIAICASTHLGGYYKSSSITTVEGSDDEDKVCWCKMVSPAVSYYVQRYVFASHRTCAYSCAEYCANGMVTETTFRNLFFTSLSD